MQDEQPGPLKKRQDTSTRQPAESCLESSGEVVVEHHSIPPKGPADKRIHPRRPLPHVPESRPKPTQKGQEANQTDSGKSTRE